MRVASYDPAALEMQIGPRDGTSGVNSANRHLVQNWLVANGVPSARAKAMKITTLWKCYNKPRYLAAVQAHIDSHGDLALLGDKEAIADLAVDFAETAPPTIATVAHAAVPAPPSGDTAAQLAALIQTLAAGAINEQRVIELIAQHAPRPKMVEIAVTDPAGERREIGMQHRQFETLLKACSARDHNGNRLNILLVGEPGSGKTQAAENVAAALGMPFFFNGAIDSEYKLLGFTDAQGRIVSRPFREAYENGGVYLFDEMDGSLPGALLAFNAATSNGQCDFPDGMVKRHPDCVIVAAANTFGHGGTDQYVGRMKQDAAFLDRFPVIRWETDESLERSICPDAAWCDYVQGVRRKVHANGLRVIVSPRASFQGASLLAAGLPRDQVVAMTVRKGMSDDQWSAVQ